MTGTAATPGAAGTLPAWLRHWASTSPRREAAVDDVEALDYATLDAAVEATAEALARAGVQAGDRVAMMAAPGVPYWVTLLATLRAGAVWLGLNPLHTARELAHVLGDARPRLCLLAHGLPGAAAEALREAAAGAGGPVVLALDAGVAGLRAALRSASAGAWPDGDDPDRAALSAAGAALVVYTSGSTGRPKGALLSQANLAENGAWIARRMGGEPVRALVKLPVSHVGCVSDLCATVLAGGGTCVFQPRFDAAGAVAALAPRRISWLAQVPAQLQLMMGRGGLAREHLAGVRWLHWGGAAMPEPLVRQLATWGPDLFNGYGQTECSGTITLTEPGAGIEALSATVGRPVAPGRVRIAGDDGGPLPDGEGGEVQLSGPHLFLGYLGQPEATRAAFTPDGWLRTGDIGRIDGDGRLRLMGRLHEMFKSGGYNVYPREIESVIEALRGVQVCAVVGTPDPLWAEVGVAFVQADPDRVTETMLRAHCAERLARYKVPKRFVVRTSLPTLPIGKIDRQRLRAEARDAADGAA